MTFLCYFLPHISRATYDIRRLNLVNDCMLYSKHTSVYFFFFAWRKYCYKCCGDNDKAIYVRLIFLERFGYVLFSEINFVRFPQTKFDAWSPLNVEAGNLFIFFSYFWSLLIAFGERVDEMRKVNVTTGSVFLCFISIFIYLSFCWLLQMFYYFSDHYSLLIVGLLGHGLSLTYVLILSFAVY